MSVPGEPGQILWLYSFASPPYPIQLLLLGRWFWPWISYPTWIFENIMWWFSMSSSSTRGGGVLPLILTEKWVAFSAQLQSCSLKQFRALTLELHLPHNYASINTQMQLGVPVIEYKQSRLDFCWPCNNCLLQLLVRKKNSVTKKKCSKTCCDARRAPRYPPSRCPYKASSGT